MRNTTTFLGGGTSYPTVKKKDLCSSCLCSLCVFDSRVWVCLPRPPVLWMKKVACLVIWLHVNMSYASMVDVCWPAGSPAVSVRWDTPETPVTKPSMRLCLFHSPSASWWSSSASSPCSLGWHFSDKGKRQRRGETLPGFLSISVYLLIFKE